MSATYQASQNEGLTPRQAALTAGIAELLFSVWLVIRGWKLRLQPGKS